jgi:hypothetical protein
MSAQLSLTYSPSYIGGQAWLKQLEVLRTAVNHLGEKEVAYAIDTAGSTLSDALNERRDRRWRAEWTHVVKAMLAQRYADEIAAGMLRAIVLSDVEASGFDLVDPDRMTPEQMVAAMTDDERKRISARVKGRRR